MTLCFRGWEDGDYIMYVAEGLTNLRPNQDTHGIWNMGNCEEEKEGEKEGEKEVGEEEGKGDGVKNSLPRKRGRRREVKDQRGG